MIKFWNNLKISSKISLIFSFLILSILFVLLGMRYMRTSLMENAETALDKCQQVAFLSAREVDHLNWSIAVAEYIANRGTTQLKVATDGTKCAFGRWLLSEERKNLELLVPEVRQKLADITDPHLRLHRSAVEIVQKINDKEFNAAENLFYGNIKDRSREIVKNLEEIRLTVEKSWNENKVSFHKMSDRFEGISIMTIISALAGSTFFSLLLIKTLSTPLMNIANICRSLSSGEKKRFPENREDEIGIIANSLNTMMDDIHAKVEEVDRFASTARANAESAQASLKENLAKNAQIEGMLSTMTAVSAKVADLVDELLASIEHLSKDAANTRDGSRDQQKRMEDVAASLHEIRNTVGDIAAKAISAAESATQTLEKAKYGSSLVIQSIDSIRQVDIVASKLRSDMEELGELAKSIGVVMNMITDIADQTNLLALNAAIEAARAGEAGRGFSVVADEVRKLAEKTMSATHEVGENITSIQNTIRRGIVNMEDASAAVDKSGELANESGQSLQEIVNIAARNMEDAKNIASATEYHASASERLLANLEDVAYSIKNNMANMERSVELINTERAMVANLHSTIGELRSHQQA